MCSSPRLFAAYRVFHRLPVPGHPPCALLCLTSCTSGPHQLKLFQSGSPVVLTCSYRRICKACPSCSLVLLAIAFSIYIRVIDSNFFYQRRGLMFDVSDLIFRSNLSLIQFSRYENACRIIFGRPVEATRVEMVRFELMTPCLQGRCSPN